jgi:hypothetical protein
MSNSLTIQLRPTKNYSAPSVANLFHNSGISKAMYWIQEGDKIIQSDEIKKPRQAVELWRSWIDEATKIVLTKKGKQPQKKQVLIEEALMIIGRDVPKTDPQTFVKIFEELQKEFEKKFDTKILYYSFHNHEGHLNENGDFINNLHIHFFFRNVDNKGESVRRKIKKSDLSELQTLIHQIGKKYIPTLERAKNYYAEGKKAPKHKSHREFRTEKQKEQLAKVKDLKPLSKELRELLKANGAKRADYADLEAFVKSLKEQIKNKELTITQLNDKIEQYKKDVFSNFTYKNTNKPVKYKDLAEFYKNELNKASQDKKKLLDRVKVLEEEKDALKLRNEELELLEEKNKQLEEELKRYRAYSFAFNKINIFQVKVTVTKQKLDKSPFEYAEDVRYINAISKMAKVDVVDFEIQKNEKGSIEAVRIETKTGTIVDTGDEITLKAVSVGDDYLLALKQNAELMFQMAISKGWDLKSVKIEGSKAFKEAIENAIKTWLGPDDDYDNDFDNDISWHRGGLGF